MRAEGSTVEMTVLAHSPKQVERSGTAFKKACELDLEGGLWLKTWREP
jgi:hypothetical protein